MIGLVILYFILYIFLAWRNLVLGLALIAALLPSYLIRFQIFGLPSTVLEGMILITVLVWIIKHGRDWRKIISNIQYQISNIKYKQWFFATILLLIAATISVFVSPNLRAALGIWKAYFVEPILLLAVFISTVKTREDINKIIWGLTLGALAVSIFAVIQKFTGWLIPNPFWQAEETRRVTSFFGYPNAVALYLAPLLPLNIYLLINLIKQTKQKILKILSASWRIRYYFKISLISLISLISFFAIVFTHSTGALVALAATAVLFGLLNKKTRWFAVGLVVMATLLLPLTSLKDPLLKEVFLRDRSGNVRIHMWAETVEMLKERPFLGAGLAAYQETVRPYHILNWAEIYLYPHNLFLNFWTETGILGLIAFLWLIGLFFGGKRDVRAGGYGNMPLLSKFLMASMLIIFIQGLVDVPYFKNDLAVMFWLLVGLRLVDSKICLISRRVI